MISIKNICNVIMFYLFLSFFFEVKKKKIVEKAYNGNYKINKFSFKSIRTKSSWRPFVLEGTSRGLNG